MQKLDYECDYFIARKYQNIVTIKLKKYLMLDSTNLELRDKVIRYLHLISKDDSIKVVVIIGCYEASRCEEYKEFYKRVLDSKLSVDDVLRMGRSLDQIMLEIVKSNKFFISVNSGTLFPEAISLDLACDYRIISDDTTFKNNFLEYEIIPKGGVTYFLEKRIGHCRACELLLTNESICADKALSIGLVNKTVPYEQLESAALETAKRFAQKPDRSLCGIKNLINYSMKDLADYLEFETQELIRILGPFFLGFKRNDR